MTERYVIVDENQSPARVLDVIEIGPDETFHPPNHIPGWRAVEVPEGMPAAEGWTWTETDGLRA